VEELVRAVIVVASYYSTGRAMPSTKTVFIIKVVVVVPILIVRLVRITIGVHIGMERNGAKSGFLQVCADVLDLGSGHLLEAQRALDHWMVGE
jgi:hypothetical protein